MVKRQRTESATNISRSSQSSPSQVDSSSAGPLTPFTAADDHHATKVQHIDTADPSNQQERVIKCSLPPHLPQDFSSYDDFETHYRQYHTNRCHECGRNFPSDHYLSLHIAENHDPLNEARRDRGEKTFACFVEGCDKVCVDSQRRRWHVIAKHEFPKNYDFFIVNDGLDKRKSMLRPIHNGHRRGASFSIANGAPAHSRFSPNDVHEEADASKSKQTSGQTASSSGHTKQPAIDVDGMTESLSALKFVPQSVRFGRGRGRGGLARQ